MLRDADSAIEHIERINAAVKGRASRDAARGKLAGVALIQGGIKAQKVRKATKAQLDITESSALDRLAAGVIASFASLVLYHLPCVGVHLVWESTWELTRCVVTRWMWFRCKVIVFVAKCRRIDTARETSTQRGVGTIVDHT